MKTITLKSEDGETIEVKRGAENAILVRHLGKDEQFGEFRDLSTVLEEPGAWEFFAKRGCLYE